MRTLRLSMVGVVILDYEGLTHVRHASGRFHGPLYHAGVVYEGELPPMIAMPEPPVTE